MDSTLSPRQAEYLKETLVPYAKKLVKAIELDESLLHPLLEKQLVDGGVLEKFMKTLAAIPPRMEQLAQENKFVINDDLPHSNAAVARTGKIRGIATVQWVELRSSLLDPDDAQPIVKQVRTLLHEVSHTIVADNDFPIVDYAYFSWAASHLGTLCAENADSLAEASMFAAEDARFDLGEPPLKGRQFLFRKYNNAVSQMVVLRLEKVDGLSAALAWVDLRLNRAWIRLNDYIEFSVRQDDDTALNKIEMRKIENQLIEWNIVDERPDSIWSSLKGTSKMLDATSITNAKKIAAAVTQVKDWFSGMGIHVKKDGDITFAQEEPSRLWISWEKLKLSPVKLGNEILERMFAALIGASSLPPRVKQEQLLSLCIKNDRPIQQVRLGDCWKALESTTATPPRDVAALYDLEAKLAFAIVDANTVFWENVATLFVLPKRLKLMNKDPGAAKVIAVIKEGFRDLDKSVHYLEQYIPQNKFQELQVQREGALTRLKVAMGRITTIAETIMQHDSDMLKRWIDFGDSITKLT